jgi:hypothetical protein
MLIHSSRPAVRALRDTDEIDGASKDYCDEARTDWHTQIVTGAGFGATIRTVNGPLECDGVNPGAIQNRIDAYLYFCRQLGIDPGPNQGC